MAISNHKNTFEIILEKYTFTYGRKAILFILAGHRQFCTPNDFDASKSTQSLS